MPQLQDYKKQAPITAVIGALIYSAVISRIYDLKKAIPLPSSITGIRSLVECVVIRRLAGTENGANL